MVEPPSGSIYTWMYVEGLKRTSLSEIERACSAAGKTIRQKDYDNYRNGLINSNKNFYEENLYCNQSDNVWVVNTLKVNERITSYFDMKLEDYPINPFVGMPEPENRFVPCSANNKPLIKWSRKTYSLVDAKCFLGSVYIGENLKGCQHIVIDCDGDHDEIPDLEMLNFMQKYTGITDTLSKPGNPCYSYHLTFLTDRIIPTMHFPEAHIDIIGNKENSLRYYKNKIWNCRQAIPLSSEIWEEVKDFIRSRQ